MSETRHAVVLTEFGDSDNLRPTDLPMPRLRHHDELLIRVRATSVNPIDWKLRQGMGAPKWLSRRIIGTPMVLGIDFAGEVVAAGSSVGLYQPGDAVMGVMPPAGTYSSHVVLRLRGGRNAVVHKPAELSYTQAALLPFAGLIGYAGLVTYGGLRKAGARILIVGASGGVGHLAVQMAVNGLGADLVVGVSSSRNEAFVRSLGAHTAVPYDRIGITEICEQFPDWAGTFDIILDCVGDDRYFTVLAPRLLKPTGRYVTAALPSSRPGRAGEDIGLLAGGALLGRVVLRRLTSDYRVITGLFRLPGTDGLPAMARWVRDGKLVPHTASTYRLDDLAAAHRESEAGRTVGKIAVEVP